MKTMQNAKGFTLIELMIVVAIIGVLAAIAIPQYNDYVGKTQVAEALTMLDGLKSPLAEAISEEGDAGCAFPAGSISVGSYVKEVTVTGTATACIAKAVYKPTVNTKVADKYLQFTYNSAAGSWACSTDLPLGTKPKFC